MSYIRDPKGLALLRYLPFQTGLYHCTKSLEEQSQPRVGGRGGDKNELPNSCGQET